MVGKTMQITPPLAPIDDQLLWNFKMAVMVMPMERQMASSLIPAAWVLPHHQSLRAMAVVEEVVLSPPHLTGTSRNTENAYTFLFTHHRDTSECFALKFEIRNSKHETNTKSECSNVQNLGT
jgi:hypothetical protein